MKAAQVGIIGAGVSGLYAASLLERAGISYAIFEARDITGGRLISRDLRESFPETQSDKQRVDLGATWVWPSLQPQLAKVMDELGIDLIPQNESGSMVYERAHHIPPARMPTYASSPPSMRAAGGMRILTERLEQHISSESLFTGHCVKRIEHTGDDLLIHTQSVTGEGVTAVNHLFLALPPALAAGITFNPALPAVLHANWAETGTWMAPHAKYVAVYETDFWRKEGLSGDARSSVGPMVEIHDASVPDGVNALFGFIGVPAKTRWTTDEANLKKLCRAQLTRLFGDQAASPVAEFYKDWASDPFTATDSDLVLQAGHSVPRPAPADGIWFKRIRGIASEWSPMFPGYLAGAIDAATEGVHQYREQLATLAK